MVEENFENHRSETHRNEGFQELKDFTMVGENFENHWSETHRNENRELIVCIDFLVPPFKNWFPLSSGFPLFKIWKGSWNLNAFVRQKMTQVMTFCTYFCGSDYHFPR